MNIQITNHKTTSSEQFEQVLEECQELHDARDVYFDRFLLVSSAPNARKHIINEAIDLAKASLKYAVTLCEENNLDFAEELKKNDEKNRVRGYCD
ncbi:MAG: hypothetical protein GY936_00130 [Ignavibacteriae bacterium]|nr:hypothetical protein [Ignavibacteriota bacterium]